ncbi:MAG TPA: YciI family protein [Candidatus Udaeobacter sp.]
MKNTFIAISSAGPNRDQSKGTREQPFWDEHAAFIDQLVDEGFILMGGPLVDEGGSLLIVNAKDENEVKRKLKNDPWARHGILKLDSVKRWQIFIDRRK